MEDTSGLQSKSHTFLTDLEIWIKLFSERPEIDILQNALLEYQYSLLALVQGQYRQAYMGLRLFLEQALATVHFSVNEYELRLWKLGKRDFHWANILDIDNGIFSKLFVNTFFEGLAGEVTLFHKLAKNVYRECSEFTHANYSTHSLNREIKFDKEIFNDWHDKAESVRILTIFSLCVRYLPMLDTPTKKQKVESSVMQYLSHLPAIQAFYGMEV